MKWFLVWLIVTVNDEGIRDSRVYQTQLANESSCMVALGAMEQKLEEEGYTDFVIMCEAR